MKINNKHLVLISTILATSSAYAADEHKSKSNSEKLADDPTKVITKVGIAYSNNYDWEDDNTSLFASLALDEARKINGRVNSDASEWRIGGSWLFPVGIVNFNFGKNEYVNGANQTNYSVGTFVPLSYFGIEPAGFQIFPMAGYNYNDGDVPACDNQPSSVCTSNPQSTPSAENGYVMVNSSGSSGYIGAFGLKPLSSDLTFMAFVSGSYGSENSEGENYKGVAGGLGLSYLLNKNHSFNAMTYAMDNNTYLDEADKRLVASYKYEF